MHNNTQFFNIHFMSLTEIDINVNTLLTKKDKIRQGFY